MAFKTGILNAPVTGIKWRLRWRLRKISSSEKVPCVRYMVSTYRVFWVDYLFVLPVPGNLLQLTICVEVMSRSIVLKNFVYFCRLIMGLRKLNCHLSMPYVIDFLQRK